MTFVLRAGKGQDSGREDAGGRRGGPAIAQSDRVHAQRLQQHRVQAGQSAVFLLLLLFFDSR